MRRAVGWLSVVAGVALIVAGIALPLVQPYFLIGGVVMFAAGWATLVDADVLRDHPDELEERRRRGAAGWQKPVAPPPRHRLPGGLPPRRPFDRERDG